MKRAGLVAILTVAALLLLMRALSPAQLDVRSPAPAQRAEGVAEAVGVRRTQVYTLADGLTAYRLTPYYTTTIAGIDWVATFENRPFDAFGRELPYHPGFHYVRVGPTVEISPTGRWDMVYSSLSYIVTETVSWKSDAVTPTGWITSVTGLSPTIVITLPVWTNEDGEISGTVTSSMVITHAIGSAPVAGWISPTRYISESGHVVSGTISATLQMVFEVEDAARGLLLDFQGLTGTFTIAAEQDPVFYSAAVGVADYGRAQFQVSVTTAATDTAIIWWPQFAPAMNGSCAVATDWSDGAASTRSYLDPDRGAYVWLPMNLLGKTIGDDQLGFQVAVGNACARMAFHGPAGVVFTPTIYLRVY